MRKAIVTLLFLTSYSPLLLALAAKNAVSAKSIGGFVDQNHFPLAMVALCALFSVATLWILATVKTAGKTSIDLVKIERRDQDVLSYVITYLVPFLGISFTSKGDVVANLILFSVMGFLYVKSNLIYINPLLSLFGYSIYETIDRHGNTKVLISKEKPAAGTHHLTSLADNIYLYVLK